MPRHDAVAMTPFSPDAPTHIVRSASIRFHFNGTPVNAHIGDSIAVALLRSGIVAWRRAPRDGAPRGLFCCMGICQECLLSVDGNVVEACRTPVQDGLRVHALEATRVR